MKRKYEKPMVEIELFQLDAAIAASCSSQGYIPINKGENDCTLDGEFFNFDNCNVDLTDDVNSTVPNDGVCYHGPSESGGLTFISS